jgi:hypothetical protein
MLALGLPLTLLSFVLVVGIEQTIQIGSPSALAIYYHVAVIFALIVGINFGISRASGGRVACSRAELLCLYSMMNIGGCFACWESLGTLLPAVAYPSYMASTRTDASWLKPVMAALPDWAVVKDPSAALAVFQGGTFGDVWHAWLVPLLAWSAILATLFGMYISLTRLFWESWTFHEKLSFPLTELPLQLTQPDATIWRSRLFWCAFAAVALFDILNGLHSIIPSFPAVNLKVTYINTSPVDPAMQAVGAFPVTFHPLMIGIGLLLRTDLLFSTWFFYLLGVAQTYFAGLFAMAHGSKYVFLGNSPGLLAQNFGAIVILGGSVVWNARRVLLARVGAARNGNRGAIADFAVLAGGSLVLIAAMCFLGLTVWLAAISVLVVLLLAIFVSRLRAELGLPVHNLQFMGPDGPITAVFNGNGLSQHTQNAFGALFAVTRSQQGHPMPFLMESAYMTQRVKGPASRMWAVLAVTGVLTIFIGPWIVLKMLADTGLERVGYNASISAAGWTAVKAYMLGQHLQDYGAIAQMGTGAVVTLFLISLGRFWISSPFHPVGYAISGSWGTGMVWTPFLIAWGIKSLALRYGGAKALRSITPIALGLILGEFAAGMIWTLLSYVTSAHCYQVWLY